MTRMKRYCVPIVFWMTLLMLGAFCARHPGNAWAQAKAAQETKAEEAAKKSPAAGSSVQGDNIVRPKVTFKAAGLKDPFRPLIEEEKAAPVVSEEVKPLPPLSVQGLLWGGAFPQAIVNGKIVKIGDKVADAQILGIDKEGVTVLFENTEHKISPSFKLGQKQEKK